MTFNDDRVGSTTRIFGIHCVFVSAVPTHVRTVWFHSTPEITHSTESTVISLKSLAALLIEWGNTPLFS